MSPYEYTDHDGDTLRVVGVRDTEDTYVAVSPRSGRGYSVRIPNADAPTVAAELLKAAGRTELAELIEAVEADRTAKAEREAAAKKLRERRDKLAAQFSSECDASRARYGDCVLPMRKAIDRIIELEDKQAA